MVRGSAVVRENAQGREVRRREDEAGERGGEWSGRESGGEVRALKYYSTNMYY